MSKQARRQLAFSASSLAAICDVCRGHHSHITSPKEWKNQDAQKYVVFSLKHSADSLVCRPCRDDIARVLANPAYIPRWRKERVEGCSSYCSVKDCNSISFTQTSLCSNSDDLKITHGIEFTNECIPIPTPLCKNHYHVLYDVLQSRRKHCITCGRRLRPGNDRPCPQPHIIQIHLSQHTDFVGDILSDARVCLTCYKSHLVILKENQPISKDEDLKVLIDTLGQQTSTMGNAQDIICAATIRMLVTVRKMLMENRAMLLPTIHSDSCIMQAVCLQQKACRTH